MSWTHPRGAAWKPARIVWLLVAAFGLTIASFVASTIVAESRARGTEAAVETIATNIVPTMECLPAARTELRRVERALQVVVQRPPIDTRPQGDIEALRRARNAFAARWARCSGLPEYEEEHTMREEVEASTVEMGAAIDDALHNMQNGDWKAARSVIASRVEPPIDRIDTNITEALDVNAHHLAILGEQIGQHRTSYRSIRAVLVGLSAVLAAVAATVMVRVVQRFTDLMEARVSEMEHFAGRVAHDIRSPLAAVGLAIELMKRAPHETIRTGVLDRASRTIQRIGQLVDGLLLFARAGAPPPEASQSDVREVLEGAMETFRPSAQENEIELTLDAPTVAQVACTPGVLISLVSNLVGNSIKYMGTSPVRRVHIRTRDLDDRVRFEVRDTGPGVPTEEGDRLFEPYVRGAASTTPGIGLGLATVRRLAEAHGGSVGFFPNEASGSVFWFELPKPQARPGSVARAREPLLGRGGLRSSARG